MHPGWVKTDMGGKIAPKTVEEGCVTQMYLIDLPYKRDPELNGKFFYECKKIDF